MLSLFCWPKLSESHLIISILFKRFIAQLMGKKMKCYPLYKKIGIITHYQEKTKVVFHQ